MPSSSRPPLSARDQLAMVPLRNRAARVVERTEARLILEIDQIYPRWVMLLRALVRLPSTRRFELEGIGLEVYSWIDDRLNLEELVDRLGAAEHLGFHESRALALSWLHNLSARGLVLLGDRTEPGRQS